jgi:pimeloyl-ACP methyl ester carboxylesterase
MAALLGIYGASAPQWYIHRMFPDPVIVKAGGRGIAVEDSGPGSGFPVIMMNGAGSRHLFQPAVAEGHDLGFRLIGYDRPGCGGSDRRPGRVVADCADDLRAITAELGISRAATWGSSAGGPYALAAAAAMPDVIAAVCVFASVGPHGAPGLDFAEGLGAEMRETIRMFFAEPGRARAEFRAQSAIMLAERGSPEWWLRRWGESYEQDAAHSREWAEYLAACERDALRADDQGSFDDDGSWDDHSALCLPWRFDLADIRAPVGLWHGLKDFLPVAHARWLADRIPHVTTHFPASEDHTNIEENNRAAAYAWLRDQL